MILLVADNKVFRLCLVPNLRIPRKNTGLVGGHTPIIASLSGMTADLSWTIMRTANWHGGRVPESVDSSVMTDLVSPIGSAWTDMLTMPWARAVAGVVILCILIAFGFYVVSSFRDYAGNTHQGPYFADSNLKEMLRRGDISEAEFRTIQTKSHGVSIVSGQSCLPTDLASSLNSSPKPESSDASLVDEPIRANRFLPPSEPHEGK